MASKMKRIAVGAVAFAAMGLVGVGTAQAGSTYSQSTTGAAFSGSYEFKPSSSTTHGPFHFWGTLNDSLNDSHAVKYQARIEAYAYNTWYTGVDADRSLNQSLSTGDQLYVTQARAHVCRDRGSLVPDNCSTVKTFTR